jgi:hypothetical protein
VSKECKIGGRLALLSPRARPQHGVSRPVTSAEISSLASPEVDCCALFQRLLSPIEIVGRTYRPKLGCIGTDMPQIHFDKKRLCSVLEIGAVAGVDDVGRPL